MNILPLGLTSQVLPLGATAPLAPPVTPQAPAASGGAPADSARISSSDALRTLFGARIQERWTADLGEPALSAAPGLDGSLLVETTRTGGIRGWCKVDADGQVSQVPDRQLPAHMHTRAAVMPDGSEILFNWDIQERGPQSFDQQNVRLLRVGADGQVVWSRDMQSRYSSSQADATSWPPVATPDGKVVVEFEGAVRCLTADGTQLWDCHNEIYGNFNQQPSAAADGTVYVVENYMDGGMFGSTRSRLHAFGPDGKAWQQTSNAIQCPVVATADHGAIVVSKGNGGARIEKFSREGKSEWQTSVDGSFIGATEGIDGSLLLLSSSPPTLSKLVPEQGIAWTHALPAKPIGLPVSQPNGDVLITTADGKVIDVVDSNVSRDPVVAASAPVSAPGKVERQEEWVVIGGVRIPRRRD